MAIAIVEELWARIRAAIDGMILSAVNQIIVRGA